jgi:hypothetical protein
MPIKNNKATGNPPTHFNIKSTKLNRDTQRANAMFEVIGAGISKVSLPAQIPIKFAQMLITGSSFFNKDIKPHEKLTQGVQCLLATAQTALMIALFVTGKEVVVAFSLVSRLLMLAEMLYQGVLLVGWAPAELSKEDIAQPATPR